MNTIEIPLYNKKKGFIANAIISKEDKDLISGYSLYANITSHTIYVSASKNGKSIKLHKLILENTNDDLVIDHIDNNGLNNTRENLRIVNKNVNSHNRKKQKNTSSKYIGVSYHKRHKKWVSIIDFNYKKYNLGTFNNEIDAAKLYDKTAINYYKSNANTNNLLTQEEIDIAMNEDFKPIERELPKYICKYKNKYSVRILINGQTIYKTTDTLEKAKNILQKILEEKKLKEIEDNNKKPIVYHNNIPIIPIKQKYNIHLAYIDEDIYHKVNMYTWTFNNGYAQGRIDGKLIKMHSYIYQLIFNKIGTMRNPIDHINHNGLDNRILNLHIVTISHNMHNTESLINSSSKYKGVVKRKTGFQSRITKNGLVYELGVFVNENEAAEAYNKKALELYGKNAFVNLIKK